MHWTELRVARLSAAALVFAAACVADTDKPCDRGRVELQGGITGCICAPGNVPSSDNTSCIPCTGDHEEAQNGSCQCETGYSRMGKSCTPMVDAGPSQTDAEPAAPSGQDDACTGQPDCAGFDADFCLPFPGAQTCAVRNCANRMHQCAADRVCCDVSAANAIFPDLSMANGICLTVAACAMGGKVVTP
jgi:hypothetical protein